MAIAAYTGQNVERLGWTFRVSVIGRLPVAHDGRASVDGSPILEQTMHVHQTLICRPMAKFDVSPDRSPIKLWVHDPQGGGNKQRGSLHVYDHGQTSVSLEGGRHLWFETIS